MFVRINFVYKWVHEEKAETERKVGHAARDKHHETRDDEVKTVARFRSSGLIIRLFLKFSAGG